MCYGGKQIALQLELEIWNFTQRFIPPSWSLSNTTFWGKPSDNPPSTFCRSAHPLYFPESSSSMKDKPHLSTVWVPHCDRWLRLCINANFMVMRRWEAGQHKLVESTTHTGLTDASLNNIYRYWRLCSSALHIALITDVWELQEGGNIFKDSIHSYWHMMVIYMNFPHQFM